MDAKALPRGRPTMAVNATFLGLAWVAVALRIYTRMKIMKKFYLEDWFLISSLLLYSVFCGTVIALAKVTELGSGKILTPDRLLLATQLGFLAEIWYIATLLILKIAIGLFFLRIALERWKKNLIYAILGSLVVFSFGTIIYNIFHCGLISSFLEFLQRKVAVQCAPDSVTLGITYTHAALTALTDWTFAFMPVLILQASLMTGREKIVVGSLMGFASISGVASLVRFKYVASIVEPTGEVFVATENLAIWSCVEAGIGIIATSIVCLRPLLRRASITSISK